MPESKDQSPLDTPPGQPATPKDQPAIQDTNAPVELDLASPANPEPRRDPTADPPVELDLTKPIAGTGGQVTLKNPSIDLLRENGALIIAGGILFLFGTFITQILWQTFEILKHHGPAEAKQLVNDSALPLVKEVANFATSVFAPLLAFILGYYFSKEKR